VAYVGDYFPPERRGWAAGWVMSGLATGQIAGVPLGTLLAEDLGFRAPFLAFAAAMAVTLVLVWKFLPHPPAGRATEPLSLRRALRSYGELLGNSQVVASTLVFLLTFFGLAFYVTYFPTWLVGFHGATAQAVAILFFFSGLAYVVGGLQAGKLSDRAGRQAVILGACYALVVAMPITPYVPHRPWLVTAAFSISLGLFAARAAPLQALLTEIVPSQRRGSLMALVLAAGQLGFGTGGALSGWVYTRSGYAACAWVAAASILITVFLVRRFLPDVRSEPVHPPISLG
jgi:predicted MFS family arabinose efflux permease